MTAGTQAVRVTETLFSPQALAPPPTRHALFLIVLGIAALAHLGTLQWGDLYNETEGQYAGAAREMLARQDYALPTNDGIPRLQKPPLLYWLIVVSYKVFGATEAATRLPLALGVLATTAIIFLLGERLVDYWRGFTAALIYVTLSGSFIFGRIVMPEPIFGAMIAGAIYCGLAGYQTRKGRREWFGGFWVCAALACLSKGPHGLLIPAATFGVLALCFREARMRMRGLLWWPYFLLFAVIILPWYLWVDLRLHGAFHRIFAGEWMKHLLGRYPNGQWYDDVPRARFVLMHLAWWFPWSLALVPPLVLCWRNCVRPRELTFEDCLPMAWAAVGFVPLLLIGQRQDYYAVTMFGGFALVAAMIWERAVVRARVFAAFLVAGVGASLAIVAALLPRFLPQASADWGNLDYRFTAWRAIGSMPQATLLGLRPLIAVSSASLLLGAAITIFLARRGHEKIAVVGIALAMLPIEFSMAQGVARVAPYFSLADAARFLNPHLHDGAEVVYEGPLHSSSSLLFYLERKFYLVNETPEIYEQGPEADDRYLSEQVLLDRWGNSSPVFLIIEQSRVAYWKKTLTERFHIFHQVTSCGTDIVLTNQL